MAISIFYDLGATTNIRKKDVSYSEETNVNLTSSSILNMFNILEDLSAKRKNYTTASLTATSSSYETETFLNIWRSAELNDVLKNNTLVYNKYNETFDENWDNIAQKYYENDELWWVIALTNNVTNPFEECQQAGTFKILKSAYVNQILKDIKNIAKL